ncbi:ribosomal-protein-alanine N-acetyltransferase [Prauserella marina]|uniref:Ribosomal-protein-alanine N-acetyltransferase n=1 Tax=Prauserella marina TaxID=530584 RepID=A0A222VKA1_9PSEU|nr:ribosomal protein S18-alanine N-acetyltransferase [Prauserella marina]ASR34141.1 ribosomal-protein-alanine N-acetyltransferase [Prauserella marina]PWV82789.1 ribosomal-protein-alanine N-acetyltransferase [Prauserella marina]SDC77310.1 ribosomal-protein-alanine N-acetyltransferase [Prauserella marina]
MRIEPLRRKHIRRCVEIERALFPGDSPWSAGAFHAELDSGAYYLAAIDDEGELRGYAGLAVTGVPGDWETGVHTIGVEKARQGQGIGTALLEALLTRADALNAPVLLEVRTDNDNAIRLYERYGFTRLGIRKRYYQPSGADAFTMRRPATQTQGVAG